jgi:transposase
VELYETYQQKIAACDEKIEAQLSTFDSRKEVAAEELEERAVKRKGKGRSKNAALFNLKAHLVLITGVDLTEIPGIEATSALKIISEMG